MRGVAQRRFIVIKGIITVVECTFCKGKGKLPYANDNDINGPIMEKFCHICDGQGSITKPISLTEFMLMQSAQEGIVQAAAHVLMRPVLKLIEADPHQWSERGCATCSSVTTIVGRSFGCVRFAEMRALKRARKKD
jgi:hypothetical protein